MKPEEAVHLFNELKEFVSIQSISCDPSKEKEMEKARQYVMKRLEGMGFITKVLPTKRHAAVYAEKTVNKERPTVLIYAHYDVQPAQRDDGWESDPFDVVEREGNFYGRGVIDNKGPLTALLRTLENFGDDLPLNVKFIIEGEEELGSANFGEMANENKELLKCDFVLVSDGLCITKENPCIEYGLRGLVYCFVRINGPNKDLHSGAFGGPIPNPHLELARLLVKCKEGKKVLIPGFYDDVQQITEEEKERLKAIPLDIAEYKKEVGVNHLYANDSVEILEQQWMLPTFDVHGITGGFTGIGGKTIIPSYAEAKVSMRLVSNQDPDKIFALFKNFIEKINPYAKITLDVKAKAFTCNIENPYSKTASVVLEKVFGQPMHYGRTGGSIPAVMHLDEITQAPIIMLPMGMPDDNMHSPNEKFNVQRMLMAVEAFTEFFKAV